MTEEELILNNTKLIYKCIKDMKIYWNTEDEFQEHYDNGLLGLIRGAKTYNPEQYKPSTYLYKCIWNEIAKGIQISNYEKRKIHKMTMVSLDQVVNEESDTTYGELIIDPDVDIENEVMNNLEKEKVISLLDILTPRQKEVVEYSYGLNGRPMLTQREIAKVLKCSLQNVNNKLQSAIRRLKRNYQGIKKKTKRVIKNPKLTFEEELKKALGFEEE